MSWSALNIHGLDSELPFPTCKTLIVYAPRIVATMLPTLFPTWSAMNMAASDDPGTVLPFQFAFVPHAESLPLPFQKRFAAIEGSAAAMQMVTASVQQQVFTIFIVPFLSFFIRHAGSIIGMSMLRFFRLKLMPRASRGARRRSTCPHSSARGSA